MQRLLANKLVVIVLLIIAFLIAFSYIRSILHERQASQTLVMRDIAASHVGPQALLGPVLLVPVTETRDCTTDNDKPPRSCRSTTLAVLTPEKSEWKNRVAVTDKAYRRGIYQAVTWQDTLSVEGSFRIDVASLKLNANQTADWSGAQFRVYTADLRGLLRQPVLEAGGRQHSFRFPDEADNSALAAGYTVLPMNGVAEPGGVLPFRLTLALKGMERLQIIPLGGDMTVQMQADWPHPMFHGASLPDKKLRRDGFDAQWQNTYLSSRNTQLIGACLRLRDNKACAPFNALLSPDYVGSRQSYAVSAESATGAAFAVNFIRPVDVYLMSDRAMKYALLFLVITFGAFFLFEVLQDLRIHPMQYTLVGTALAVFYLLLLSFSEHIDFALAYLVSGIACIGLIVFYVSHVLQGAGRALGLGGLLALMYGTLFVILQSEDFTLMLGSVLVFLLLATVMTLTRRINWYGAENPPPAAP